MTTLVLDTHRLIESLKLQGFSDTQAAGISAAIQEIDLSHLATKAGVADIKTEIRVLEARMLKWIIPLLLGQTALFAAIVGWLVA